MSMKNAMAVLTLGTLPWLTACGGEAPKQEAPKAEAPKPAAAAPAAGGGTGSMTGKISFEGTVPAATSVKLIPECKALRPEGLKNQSVSVKDGGLADVVVYVKSGATGTFTAPTQAVELTQKGCSYTPHVVALQAGQPLEIINADDTLHNIHPRPKDNAEFNLGQPRKGMKSTKTFEKPEVLIPVGCDVHPWMRAYIAVLANPYFAISKEDGTFEIKGLPAGEYEIEAVHEKLDRQTQKVTIKAGEAATLNLTFKG